MSKHELFWRFFPTSASSVVAGREDVEGRADEEEEEEEREVNWGGWGAGLAAAPASGFRRGGRVKGSLYKKREDQEIQDHKT